MSMRLALISLSALTLCACTTAPKSWDKGTAVSTDLERDKAQCPYEAKAATASYQSTPSRPGRDAAVGTAIGDGIVIADKQVDLTNDCMKARGYVPR